MTFITPPQVFYLQRHAGLKAFFRDQDDYRYYLRILMQSKDIFDIDLRAFCLLPKEIHIILAPSSPVRLAEFAEAVEQLYRVYYQSRRPGNPGWGHTHMMDVGDAHHLAHLIKEMEFLPVNTGLALSPAHYPWSSYLDRLRGANGRVFRAPPGDGNVSPAPCGNALAAVV